MQNATNQINFRLQLQIAIQDSPFALQATLNNLMQEDEETALREAALLFLDPYMRNRLIYKINHTPSLFKLMVDNSYYHENGFDKIVLLQGTHFKLRLHRFYPAASSMPAENIHNHRWNFASAMLHGSFHTVNYVFSDNGERLYHNTYYADKRSGSYTVEQIGTCCVQPIQDNLIKRGQTYYMPNKNMHRITGINPGGATTIIVTGASKAESCVLLSKRPFKKNKQKIISLTKKRVQNTLMHFCNV